MPSLLERIALKLRIDHCALRGRLDGEWHVLEEFDEPKKLSDIRDIIDMYIEEGYDYFTFECYDKQGRRVKRMWAKRVSKKQQESYLERLARELQRFNEAKERLKEILGVRERSIEDVLAELTYYENLKEVIAKKLGPILGIAPASTGGSFINEVREFLELLRMLKEFGVELPFMKARTRENQPMVESEPRVPKEVEEEAEKIVKEIEEKTSKELMEELAACKKLEGRTCPAAESGG